MQSIFLIIGLINITSQLKGWSRQTGICAILIRISGGLSGGIFKHERLTVGKPNGDHIMRVNQMETYLINIVVLI